MILKCQLSLKKNNRTLSYSLYIPVWPSFFRKKSVPRCCSFFFSCWSRYTSPKVRPEITCCSIEGLLHPSKTYVSKLLASHGCFCLFKVGIFGSFFRFVMHHRIVDALLMRFGSLLCASDSRRSGIIIPKDLEQTLFLNPSEYYHG